VKICERRDAVTLKNQGLLIPVEVLPVGLDLSPHGGKFIGFLEKLL
jgi:hypothetical protein